MTTTTAIAETEARACLLGLTIAGQGINIGCLGKRKPRAAQPSIKEFCGPPGSGKAFTPLAWSKTDSQATKEVIREYNAAGREAGCWK